MKTKLCNSNFFLTTIFLSLSISVPLYLAEITNCDGRRYQRQFSLDPNMY